MIYHQVEGRWENTRESVAEARYFKIAEDVRELSAAKQRAQEYLYRRVSRNGPTLEWVEGSNGTRPAYYARTASITFRITG